MYQTSENIWEQKTNKTFSKVFKPSEFYTNKDKREKEKKTNILDIFRRFKTLNIPQGTENLDLRHQFHVQLRKKCLFAFSADFLFPILDMLMLETNVVEAWL